MNPLVIGIIEMVLGLMAPFLKKLVDLAYQKIEEWAHKKEKEEGVKPTSEEKMKKAIAIVKEAKPNVSEAVIKSLLELAHAKQVGKTAGAKAKRQLGQKPS